MAGRKKSKSRYTLKELKAFDALIDSKLENAEQQFEFYRQQLSDLALSADAKVKGLGDGTNTFESERIAQLALRQQRWMQHLLNAKIRIKNNVYGICRATGKLISKERLKAVPHATLSIEAKQRGLG